MRRIAFPPIAKTSTTIRGLALSSDTANISNNINKNINNIAVQFNGGLANPILPKKSDNDIANDNELLDDAKKGQNKNILGNAAAQGKLDHIDVQDELLDNAKD